MTGTAPFAVAAGELDGETGLDLAVANLTTGDVSVLLNNGDGVFADEVRYLAGDEPRALAAALLDADQHLDLGCCPSREPHPRPRSHANDRTPGLMHVFYRQSQAHELALDDASGLRQRRRGAEP